MNAYEAILEALIGRGRTGKGADIRVSMFDSMMEWMAVPLLHGQYGTPPKRIGFAHPSRSRPTACSRAPTDCRSSSPSRTTASGRCSAPRMLERPELITDPRFINNETRRCQPARHRRPGRCAASPPAMSRTLARQLEEAQIAFARVNEVLEASCAIRTSGG